MNVWELIKKLQTFPGEMNVITTWELCWITYTQPIDTIITYENELMITNHDDFSNL